MSSLEALNGHPYHFAARSVFSLAVGTAIVLLGNLVVLRERWSRIGVRFWAFHGAIALWLLAFGMAWASGGDEDALRWFEFGTVGVVWIPAVLVDLASEVVRRQRELRVLKAIVYGCSALFCITLLGADLFIRGIHRYPWGNYPDYGGAGALFVAYFAAVGATVLVLFFRAYRLSTYRRNRRRFLLVLGAVVLGYMASLDFVAALGAPLRPIGALSFALYLAPMSIVVLRYRLVDITPELASGRILETMQGAVIVVDLEGEVRVVNRMAAELLGRGREDIIGRPLGGLIPLVPGSTAADGEAVWTTGDGRAIDVSVSTSPLLDERDGRPLGTVYVAYDVSEQKRSEAQLLLFMRELADANRKLETLDRLKSDFVSTVSHELRTPLTSIKAFTELLLIKPGMEQDRKERLLRIMNDESDRLGRLINDLLDLARIEAGTAVWRSAPASLDEVVRASTESMLPLMQKKGLQMTLDLEEDLPFLRGDRDRLVQVMTNLLSNAVKFTPEGGSITVVARREEGPSPQVAVSVSDTGSGIPQEDLGLIFNKFHRAPDHRAEMIEGTGLGLTIAREIVEHHGGSISVSSSPGAGSTFRFTLPVAGTAGSAAGA